MRTEEVLAGHHDFDDKGACIVVFQRTCIVPGCGSRPKTTCFGCTCDVVGHVWVCKPADGKNCWKILHQARTESPTDALGNPIPRPNLTHKRPRNRSFGVEFVPRSQRKRQCLNPLHDCRVVQYDQSVRNMKKCLFFQKYTVESS